MKTKTILLEAKNIIKKFGDITALNDVSIKVETGKVIGLIGENGSGKSTFSSILSGIIKPTNGVLSFEEKPYVPVNMIDALAKGVGIIVQEEGTVSGVTVAENIFLGNLKPFKKFGLVNKNQLFQKAQSVLEQFGLNDIRADRVIDFYSQEERKLIEVVKVLMENPKILIIDETTTALSQSGRDFIYQMMQEQSKKGGSVLFISHDLEELMEHCNQLIVLRDGDLITTLEKNEFDEHTIKTLMVGRELEGAYYREDFIPSKGGEVLLSCNEISFANKVKDISLSLHSGEILGIGGLSHCGMHELGKILYGFIPLHSGTVFAEKSKEEITTTKKAMKNKIGYVSKNRDHESLALNSSVKDNIAIGGTDILAKKMGYISTKNENAYVEKQIEQLKIKTPNKNQTVQFLSGGNKQKVVFGKWLARDCDILILDCPTRGVDIGVKTSMYRLMEEMKAKGKGIILISEELPELLGMSDRLLIMKDGVIKKEFHRSRDLKDTDVIQYMV